MGRRKKGVGGWINVFLELECVNKDGELNEDS